MQKNSATKQNAKRERQTNCYRAGGKRRPQSPFDAQPSNFNRKPPTARFPLPVLAARSRRIRIFLTVRFPASASGRPLSGVRSPTARKPAPRKAARKIRMQNSTRETLCAKLYAKQPRMQNPARGICLKKRGANKKIFAKPARLGCRKAGGLRTGGLRVACLRAVCLCAGGLRVARL